MNRGLKSVMMVLALLLLVSQCRKQEDDEIYYRVGKNVITREDVDQFWLNLPDQMKVQYMDKKGRQELLNNMISLELLYQEALRQKLDQDPTLKFKIEMSKKNLLAQAVVERAVNVDELYLYYQDNFIRLDGLSFKSQAEAEANYSLLKKGADFKTLKAKISPKEKDQDLGYFSRDDLIAIYGPETASEVFGLKKDQNFTAPIQTKQGWFIFYVMERPGNLSPQGIESVEDEIVGAKREEFFRGLINDLKSRIPVKPNQKAIDAFLQVGAEWEKNRLTPQPGATVSAPGETVSPLPSATTPE